MKRIFLAALLAVFFQSAAESRPNFIFILIDHMGYADLSCYGNRQVRTPNIDRLAQEGIRFTQFYVASPICSPSRTAFLTGQFPARWQINSYLASRKENERRGIANWLDPKAPSLARTLHAAGYATGHFGKWHMGGQRDVGDAPLISEYGFDESLTQFEGLGDRILPLCDAFDGKPPKKFALGSDTLGHGNIIWMDRSKVTSAYVNNAVEFIKKSAKDGKPFYVNVWPDDVHSPFFPPKSLRGNQSKKELYLGVVKALDEQLAPLFDLIRNDTALASNTMVIVSSDNGPEPGAGSAAPFRGHKGNLYEGGVREPFIVWSPGLLDKKSRGTTNEKTVVAGMDLFPSLAKLAGVSTRQLKSDGEDLSRSLLGRAQQTRAKEIFWNRPPDRPGEGDEIFPDLAVRDGDWKLLMMEDGGSAQLYNLARDTGEKQDVAAANAKTVGRLKKNLLAWRATLPISKPLPAAGKL